MGNQKVTKQNDINILIIQSLLTLFDHISPSFDQPMSQNSSLASNIFDSSSSDGEYQKSQKVQGRKFIIVYDGLVQQDYVQLTSDLKTIFNDKDLSILQYHWSDSKQVIYICLSKRRKLSLGRWTRNLEINGLIPRLICYEKSHLYHLSKDLNFHYPERKQEKLIKLMKKQMTSKQFLDANPHQLYKYPQIKRSLEVIESEKMEDQLKKNRFKKRRGVYLYGPAGTGKTTIAVKRFLDQKFYQKAMTTITYDAYFYEKSILYDEMNPKNSKLHLDQLKNIVNVLPAAVNVKFGSKIINPQRVVITSQYKLNQLTSDSQLLAALGKRFRFYNVTRQGTLSKLTQFNRAESDQSGDEQYIFTSEQLGFNQPTKKERAQDFNSLMQILRQQLEALKVSSESQMDEQESD